MRFFVGVLLFVIGGVVFAGEFVPGVAVADAGNITDPGKDKFYAFYIPAGTSLESILPEMMKNLSQAAKAKANLAVIGPDYTLSAKILKTAFQAAPKSSLEGATVLYVNGGESVDDLKSAAAPTGAIFRATKYSGK